MKGDRLKECGTAKGDWGFSVCLLIGYLLIFQLWIGADREFVTSSGVLWGLVFGVWLMVSRRNAYFVNRLDFLAHWVVVIDVLLEALLLVSHDHLGFWLCGAGFAIVIGGYRISILRRIRGVRSPK